LRVAGPAQHAGGGVQIASVAPAAASRASGLTTGGLCSRLQATIGEVIDEATL